MEPILTFFALPGVLKDGLAQRAKEVSWHFIGAHDMTFIQCEAHSSKVILGTRHTERLCS